VSYGLDTVQFNVSTNPGQETDKLEKVVSGGELSRIGLAIQVIASDNHATPTMIFDEVDTGISGPTASIVGGLLRRLGKAHQVMCVTHLPQVAAQAHNQLFVTKLTDGESTETQMLALTKQDRIDELARLLAGDKVTKSALANAKELLKSASSN
ncbi:MAG TPA: DNA repair protein RecN, partial [Cytophagales bacterium]|nr:DNA repair protein RecN [Cytophagales bacterium]